jgi:hypothetical protein
VAVKEYQKSTSVSYDATPDKDCQNQDAFSGVENDCGCIPGIPDFTREFTIVNSVNGMAGDVVLALNETYIYEQTSAASVWTITHSLGRYPSVTVVDSAGSVVVGDVQYTSKNQIILTFQGAFSGTAYLN